MKRYLAALGIVGLLASTSVWAEDPAPPTADPNAAAPAAATPATEHLMVAPGAIKWQDAPPSLPKGAKIAVLSGDPASAGMFVMRVKVPAGYKVPPHFHPADEYVTILSGELYMVLGDKLVESKGHALSAGSFSVMPQGMHHAAWTKRGATFQLNGMGPWGITYIDPTDDPRTGKQATK